MTNRKPKTPTAAAPAPAAQAPEPTPAVTTTYLRGLDDYLMVNSPNNVKEAAILDGVRRELTRRHDDIEAVIKEKMDEGFSLSDIHELYSVEVALMPIVEQKDGGRVKVRWPFVFVERDQ